MAVAKCGMMLAWDSPFWCSGETKDKKDMCLSCPWYVGNKKQGGLI